MFIDGIGVVVENGQLSPEEVQFYINKIEKNSQKKLQKITFSLGDGYMDLRYAFRGFPFERIRRLSLAAANRHKKAI